METPFQLDKFHFNNHLGGGVIGDRFSGFCLDDQSQVICELLNETVLTPEQVQELQRVMLILAQQEHRSVLRPLAWGVHAERHYFVYPDFGRTLSSFENLKALPPSELLMILRRLLKALSFADSKGIHCHQSIRPDNIRISLEQGEVKLGYFGYPLIELAGILANTDDGPLLLGYFPPVEFLEALSPVQYDLYALGLLTLELGTGTSAMDILPAISRLETGNLRASISTNSRMPLPLQELVLKLLMPEPQLRYESYQHALDDVVQLAGVEDTSLRFNTFILETLVNGHYQLGAEIARSRISHIYTGTDIREEGSKRCVVKLTDLRSHPELSGAFNTRFKQLAAIQHEHLMDIYEVGIHFENGYIAMESGLQSLEQLLIKRGTLPLADAGRIVFQIIKALEGLHFASILYHGGIKPSNVFLSNDLRKVKLGDALVSDFFLRQGNLNYFSAEYYNPEFLREQPCDPRSDIYCLGSLFFEMLVGHPPFSFRIEQELIDDHLHLNAATRIEPALIANDVKDVLLRMLEKNPSARYQTVQELKDELTVLLGYDKKEQVEVPNLFFDFAELSLVGKNTREKMEETLAVRLPAVNNRARGAIALLVGHGREFGDASKAAQSALKGLRELLFNPGSSKSDLAKVQKSDPSAYLDRVCYFLNQRMYREAFAASKTKSYGVSALIGVVQENTLYLHRVGEADFTLFARGEILDHAEDKWTIADETELGDAESALSAEVQERIGFGEMVRVQRLRRRLKDGDQLLLVSHNLTEALSISELKELVTSTNDPMQAIELVRSDAIRRRLEGTISCVLLNVGNVMAFAEEKISHSKRGMLARNFLAQGDSYMQDGRIDDAVEQYQQALEINPNFSIIHHQLGVAYLRKGLMSYAQSCFERALELNNKLSASYVEIVKILLHQRKHREALTMLRGAVNHGCRDSDLFAQLGRELLRARNFDEAILYTSYALELNAAHPTAFRDRMVAIRQRNSIGTKMMKAFEARPRLADDSQTRVEQEVKQEEGEI
jgi:serine/threonine protein kinase/tetratricopeptide (TPR) repeat protein